MYQNPTKFCSSSQYLGKIVKVEIGYSKDIIQQEFQTEIELTQLVWVAGDKMLASWGLEDDFSAELHEVYEGGEVGETKSMSMKMLVPTDNQPLEIRKWYDKNLRGQRIFLKLTTANGWERIFNPLKLQMRYEVLNDYSKLPSYEFNFQPARLLSAYPNTGGIVPLPSEVVLNLIALASCDIEQTRTRIVCGTITRVAIDPDWEEIQLTGTAQTRIVCGTITRIAQDPDWEEIQL